MVNAITNKEMANMTLAELRQFLNVQIGLKSKMNDDLLRLRAGVGQYTTNIHNLKARIGVLAPTVKPVEICDHAVVRYLERVKGVNMDEVRAEMDTEILQECVSRAPTGWHRINGVTYVTEHRTLVTVIVEEGSKPSPTYQTTG